MEGLDHPCALEPDELAAIISRIRDTQAAMGDGRKDGPTPEESGEMYTLGRRSLIVARDLPAGTVLDEEMITVQRPGFGVPPKHLGIVVGRALKIDAAEDDILRWDMV
jgi:N,N'-diacetyllegionaminate synthase